MRKKTKQRQSNFSALFGLFLQHAALEKHYREIGEAVQGVRFKAWMERQAEFHGAQRQELQHLFQEFPEVPVKLAEEGKDYLKEKESKLIRAANQESKFGLVQLFTEAESYLYQQYSSVLKLKYLVTDVRTFLKEKQQDLILRTKRLQRLSLVPSEQSFNKI